MSVGAGARSVRQESLRRAPIHPPTHSDSQPLTTKTHSDSQRRGILCPHDPTPATTPAVARSPNTCRIPPPGGTCLAPHPCQSSAGAAVVGNPPSRLPRRRRVNQCQRDPSMDILSTQAAATAFLRAGTSAETLCHIVRTRVRRRVTRRRGISINSVRGGRGLMAGAVCHPCPAQCPRRRACHGCPSLTKCPAGLLIRAGTVRSRACH